MNQAQVSNALFGRFRDLWPSLSSGVAYHFDNVSFRPAGVTAPFARVGIISLDSEQHTIGPRAKLRREGIVEVRLYGATGNGRLELDQLAEHVRTIYERRRVSGGPGELGIICESSTCAELRRDRDSSEFWILAVTTPFYYHQIGP